jgi:hypothetical protein
MKAILGSIALAAMLAVPALAAYSPGGIDGHIVDAGGQPVGGAVVGIFRLPLHRFESAVATVKTNSRGYFSKLPVEPGRYMVMVTNSGYANACAVHDIYNDSVTRVRMTLDAGSTCAGPRMHTALVNGDLTASVYVIH